MLLRKICLSVILFISYNVSYSQVDTLNSNTGTIPQTSEPDTLNSTVVNGVVSTGSNVSAPPFDEEVYRLKPAVDIPIILICGGWSGFAFTKIYNKDRSTEQQIMELDKNDIPKFDRWVAGNSDENAAKASDYLFYGSIPYAFTLLLDKEIRRDGLKVGMLYLEAMSITGLFYTGSVYLVDRYRPETYNTDIPVEERTSGNYKDSFIGGHPALVATSTFFTASVIHHYHPESAMKYVAYGVAIAATGTTAYLRYQAGKHFPSDLLTGITVGTLSGLLVPKFHLNKDRKDQRLGLYPFGNGSINGITAIYTFK